jgi:hypothetical protein
MEHKNLYSPDVAQSSLGLERIVQAVRMRVKEFVDKYEDRIHGVLSCFDRMLFRGYLPLMSGWAMAEFLNSLDLRFNNLKPFLMENAQRVKEHAMAVAKRHNRPYQYLSCKIRMEDAAKEMAKRDGIIEGLRELS